MDKELIYASFITHNAMGDEVNVADALLTIANSIYRLAEATDRLGVGTVGGDRIAPTNMGAIELLASEVRALGNKFPHRD